MFKIAVPILFSLFTLSGASAEERPEASDRVPLTLRIEGLASDTGHVICTLYTDASSWLQEGAYQAVVEAKPKNGVATCVFNHIAHGVYGVSFIHDLNDDKDMDENFFGMPQEPWGVSRDAPLRFGPPSFKDASFSHPSTTTQIAHPR